jgi:hypothetical protein
MLLFASVTAQISSPNALPPNRERAWHRLHPFCSCTDVGNVHSSTSLACALRGGSPAASQPFLLPRSPPGTAWSYVCVSFVCRPGEASPR